MAKYMHFKEFALYYNTSIIWGDLCQVCFKLTFFSMSCEKFFVKHAV